jgi:hypothetical protein
VTITVAQTINNPAWKVEIVNNCEGVQKKVIVLVQIAFLPVCLLLPLHHAAALSNQVASSCLGASKSERQQRRQMRRPLRVQQEIVLGLCDAEEEKEGGIVRRGVGRCMEMEWEMKDILSVTHKDL